MTEEFSIMQRSNSKIYWEQKKNENWSWKYQLLSRLKTVLKNDQQYKENCQQGAQIWKTDSVIDNDQKLLVKLIEENNFT